MWTATINDSQQIRGQNYYWIIFTNGTDTLNGPDGKGELYVVSDGSDLTSVPNYISRRLAELNGASSAFGSIKVGTVYNS